MSVPDCGKAEDGVTAGYARADRFRSLDANRLAELSIYFAPEIYRQGMGSSTGSGADFKIEE